MWDVIKEVFAWVGIAASIGGFGFALIQAYLIYHWKRRITWDDALRVADRLLAQIEADSWKPDLVVGIGRSGGIWGGWLAGNLGTLPFAIVDVKYEEGKSPEFPAGEDVLGALLQTYGSGTNVLVVEGATTTGDTFQEFSRKFGSKLERWKMRTGVLYRNPVSKFEVDYVGHERLSHWPLDDRPFPWNKRACYRPFLGRLLNPRRTRIAFPSQPGQG